MKILYIEDELTKNIDRLRGLFSHYLDEKIISELKRLETDEYGAKPQEIKDIIKATNIIEIEDRFPDAMRKIVHGNEQYDCYIVDRNLVENPYEFSEVSAIDQNYNETLHKKYQTREGDYLLNWLIINSKEPRNTLRKFHFLTAYNENDVRGKDIIEMYLDFGAFTQEQFFDKGNKPALDKLKYKIDHIVALNIRYENRIFLDILRTYLDEKYAERFLKVLIEKDEKKRIGDNLMEIRVIYEAMLDRFAKDHPEMRSVELNKSGKKIKLFNEFNKLKKDATTIDWLNKNEHINDILRNFFFSFKGICGESVHPSSYQPTINTVNALVYALKDTILWFGDKCRKQS